MKKQVSVGSFDSTDLDFNDLIGSSSVKFILLEIRKTEMIPSQEDLLSLIQVKKFVKSILSRSVLNAINLTLKIFQCLDPNLKNPGILCVICNTQKISDQFYDLIKFVNPDDKKVKKSVSLKVEIKDTLYFCDINPSGNRKTR